MKKKAVLLALAGFMLGALICAVFVLAKGSSCFPGTGAIVLYFLLYSLFGAISMGSSIVYSIEEWGLLRATLTHFAIVFTGFIILAAGFGWFSLDSAGSWIMVAVFLLAYFLIWLILFLIYRHKIREINDELKNYNAAQKNSR